MKKFNLIRMALESLKINKIRTFLSMLGVIVGVSSLIVIISFGYGAQYTILSSIESLGSNVVIVVPGKDTRLLESMIGPSFLRKPLVYEDVQYLKEKMPDVKISPELNFNTTVKFGNQEVKTIAVGINEDLFDVSNYKIDQGRKFVAGDIVGYKNVCILGNKISGQLFGSENPVGRYIRVLDSKFYIIGTLQHLGAIGYIDMDNVVLVPITTIQAITGQKNVQVIYAKAPTGTSLDLLGTRIKRLLTIKHGMENFSLISESQYIELASTVTNTLTVALTVIGLVALIVGGIGIMNIMLASVAERTREIGIRKAIGAKERDILLQFLLEAAFISTAGGLLGIIIGIILSSLSNRFFATRVTSTSMIVGFLVAVSIGIFFGVYPARKASKLNPVDALRYE
ncbi:MAG: multidrug ABC transporter substrate-binding protein [Caldiserica bacterium CG_4_8_14_3_um_filter_35_18]|nr:MAG: multidrug ABC transporter substrate-binding protein [Caldiserica bacterium CG_4_8_14_3_um_filter_35_18]